MRDDIWFKVGTAVLILTLLVLSACTTEPAVIDDFNSDTETVAMIDPGEIEVDNSETTVEEDPLERTYQLVQEGLYGEAEAFLSQATDVNSPWSNWKILGSLRLSTGDLSGAVEAFRIVLESQPNEPDTLLALATTLGIQGNRDEKRTLLDQLILAHPDFVPAYVALGNESLVDEDYSSAKDMFLEANGIEPSAGALEGLARIALDQEENPVKASQLLDTAILLEDDNPSLYALRHQALVGAERYLAALSDIDMAIELDPENPWYFYDRGLFLWRRLNRLERARSDFERTLQLNPSNPLAWSDKGEVELLIGDIPAAYDSFLTALELSPSSIGIYPKLSLAALTLGDFETAITCAEPYIQAYPTEFAFPLITSLAQNFSGDPRGAKATLESAARFFDRGSLKWEVLRFLMDPRYDFNLRNGLSTSSDNQLKARIQFYLGYHYLKSDFPTLAMAAFEQVLELVERGIPERVMAAHLLAEMVL